MTLHDLSPLFRPRSVAVIGASDRPDSVGGVTFRNIVEAGFVGPVHPVNLEHSKVQGRRTYRSVEKVGSRRGSRRG